MASANHLLISATIFLSFLLVSPSPLITIGRKNPFRLIRRACSGTKNYRFCMHTLRPNPRAVTAKNAMSLAKVVIELGRDKAVETGDFINGLRSRNDPKLVVAKPAIDVCVNSYQSIVTSFKMIYTELREDAMSANYDTMVMLDQIGSCESALARANLILPEISSKNEVMKYHIWIAAAVTNLV